jgi:hypothetical protein
MGGEMIIHRRDEICIVKFQLKTIRGRCAIGDLDTDARIILKCVLSNWFNKMTGLMWPGIGTSGAILRYSNEVSGSIKSKEYLV